MFEFLIDYWATISKTDIKTIHGGHGPQALHELKPYIIDIVEECLVGNLEAHERRHLDGGIYNKTMKELVTEVNERVMANGDPPVSPRYVRYLMLPKNIKAKTTTNYRAIIKATIQPWKDEAAPKIDLHFART